MKYIFDYRAALLFAGVFIVGFAIQLSFFLNFPVADRMFWSNDALLILGEPAGPSALTDVHPGSTIIYPVAGLIRLGVEPVLSVKIVMAMFVAFFAALAGVVAHRLWPGHLWWLAVVGILLLDLRFLHATPPSSAASIVTISFALLLWRALKEGNKQYLSIVSLSAVGGILLATRTDTGAFVLVTSLPFLLYTLRWRAILMPIVSGIVFFACNPYMWADPISYLRNIPVLISSFGSLKGIDILIPFSQTFPFALASIALSVILVAVSYYKNRSWNLHMPLAVYVWLLGATLLLTMLLIPLEFHPRRYFMPLYLVWDILLPLWIYKGCKYLLGSNSNKYLIQRRVEWIVIAFIVLLFPIRLYLLMTGDTMEFII